ncbi:OLC1v1002478C1 [Oldenlandia corymbosa var. corymbosa]|uniref:very-long-chain 3-oxoacyl-CoA synthase n=1 Tax=Oldenlandia corymbosa var. corymbosa TaxID=529605 RepID=A0AAV1D8G6_OLDCO|nr:OLC1v1002478C1 [Oldenlandia corymbosa var. corymbosa]
MQGSTIHYWLVEHPIVSQFEWKQGITFGSSPLFLKLSLLTYLTLTFILHRFPVPPPFRPATLRFITAVHSLFLCILSVIMAAGCILSTLHHIQMRGNDWTWAVCFPADRTPPRGPTFFWAQIFYLSKLLEFIDTLLILLSSSRSRRLSFLHVYHHTVVVIMCYLWLSTSQTLFPVGLVTNASVHIVMYAYYMLSALGIRPRWKRFVTNFQIFQFVFGFAISGLMLYYHFTGSGCSGMPGWCFNTIFNGTLLALFLDFHSKNYGKESSKMA